MSLLRVPGHGPTRLYSEGPCSIVSRGAVRSAASSYAAMRMVAGSRLDLVIA